MPRYNIKTKPGDAYTVVTIEVETVPEPFIYEVPTPDKKLASEVALAKHATIQSKAFDNPYIGDYSQIISTKVLKTHQIPDEQFLDAVWKWYPNEYMDKWEPDIATKRLADILRKEEFLNFLSVGAKES